MNTPHIGELSFFFFFKYVKNPAGDNVDRLQRSSAGCSHKDVASAVVGGGYLDILSSNNTVC